MVNMGWRLDTKLYTFIKTYQTVALRFVRFTVMNDTSVKKHRQTTVCALTLNVTFSSVQTSQVEETVRSMTGGMCDAGSGRHT